MVEEADLDGESAEAIAASVEERVLRSGLHSITTSLVRELVDNALERKRRLLGIGRCHSNNKGQRGSRNCRNEPTANRPALSPAAARTTVSCAAGATTVAPSAAYVAAPGTWSLWWWVITP